MSSALHTVPDVTTFAANVVVFLAAIAAAVAGSMSAVKKIKKAWLESIKDDEKPIPSQKLIGTLLMETTTAAMLSESQRDLCEIMRDVKDELKEHRFAMVRLTDKLDKLNG